MQDLDAAQCGVVEENGLDEGYREGYYYKPRVDWDESDEPSDEDCAAWAAELEEAERARIYGRVRHALPPAPRPFLVDLFAVEELAESHDVEGEPDFDEEDNLFQGSLHDIFRVDPKKALAYAWGRYRAMLHTAPPSPRPSRPRSSRRTRVTRITRRHRIDASRGSPERPRRRIKPLPRASASFLGSLHARWMVIRRSARIARLRLNANNVRARRALSTPGRQKGICKT